MFIDEEGRVVKQWEDNIPGFVTNFATRNNLTQRLATNIKTSRASEDSNKIKKFSKKLRLTLKEPSQL